MRPAPKTGAHGFSHTHEATNLNQPPEAGSSVHKVGGRAKNTAYAQMTRSSHLLLRTICMYVRQDTHVTKRLCKA
jgi:hypothetical protein